MNYTRIRDIDKMIKSFRIENKFSPATRKHVSTRAQNHVQKDFWDKFLFGLNNLLKGN
jgi:hypothetical protein